MTITMRHADVELEQDLFWCLVEWARRSRTGRSPKEALHLALSDASTLEEFWVAAMLLDARVREPYLEEGLNWTDLNDYYAWLAAQPLDVLLALPGVLQLTRDYSKLITSRSATIRIAREVDQINPAVASTLRSGYRNGYLLGTAGIPWAPYF